MKTIFSGIAFCLLSLFFLPACYNYYYIVRHAEKGPQANPDTQTQIADPEGLRRAEALRDTLLDKHVTVIFQNEFLRTRQTAAPTALALGITPTQYTTASGVPSLVTQLKTINNRNVLVVGHSDTVPDIIFGLTGEQVPNPLTDFDNLFVVKRYRCPNPDKYVLYKRTYGRQSP